MLLVVSNREVHPFTYDIDNDMIVNSQRYIERGNKLYIFCEMILEIGVLVLHPHPSRCLCILFFPETRGKHDGDTGHSGSWIGPGQCNFKASEFYEVMRESSLAWHIWIFPSGFVRSEIRSKLANLSNFIVKIGIISILVEIFCDII